MLQIRNIDDLCTRLSEGCTIVPARVSNNKIRYVSFFAVDIDGCGINWIELKEKLETFQPNIVYPTFSHTDDNNVRCRLIWLLDKTWNFTEKK